MTPAKKSGPPPGGKKRGPGTGGSKRPPATAGGTSKGRGAPQRGGKPQRGSSGNTKPSQPTAAPQWPRRPVVDVHDPEGVRLQKLLAAAGVGSRRVCEDLISAGRVEVDGQVVTELGVRIRPTQTVHVDGVRVQLDESRVYLAFNKPVGVVTSMSDELGRADIGDFVGNRKERLFHVGRLDADTEGLLILTNDGELAHRLQHPRYGVLKTYLAQIPGPVPRDLGRRLREGIELDDGPVRVDSFRIVDSAPGKALVEVVLHEGRKHIVRRMLAEVGHPVITLVRTQVGPIHLGDTRPGKWRNLSSAEVGALYAAAEM
jgi:23S rRNA pseudouridine2605 synthase